VIHSPPEEGGVFATGTRVAIRAAGAVDGGQQISESQDNDQNGRLIWMRREGQ
jgi:hypothetical protein